MSYSLPQISDIQLKADKTLYRLGTIAYDDMLYEDSEDIDYERDIIFIYKKATEYADNFYVGYTALDKIVERLAAKITIYDYGTLNPIYSDAVISISQAQATVYVLKSTGLDLGPGLLGSNNFQESTISIDLDFAYIKEEIRDYYLHDQQVASTTWTVTHNMNKYPSINIVDSSNDIIMGDVKYNSLNQLTITFTANISGKAYLN
jgi:hypothetical protein